MVIQLKSKKQPLILKETRFHEYRYRKISSISNANWLLEGMKGVHPGLMLLDWDICKETASELVSSLRQLCPNLMAVALGNRSGQREAALLAGMDEYLCKTDPPEKLYAIALQ